MPAPRAWPWRCASGRPVAIIDLGLPPDPDGVSEGFATLEALTRQLPEMKVIVATSHGDRVHALRAVGSGAYDFCEKPHGHRIAAHHRRARHAAA